MVNSPEFLPQELFHLFFPYLLFQRQKSQDFLRLQMEHLASYQDTVSIENVMSFLDLAQELNLELDLWQCQNLFYDLHGDPKFEQNLSSDTAHAFHELGQRLGFLLEGE